MPALTYEQLQRKVQELEEEALRRKQADEALQMSEERYRMIFDCSPMGIVHVDNSGIIADCNVWFEEFIGSSKEKLIGFNMTGSMVDERMRATVIAGLSGKPNCFEGNYLSATCNRLTCVRAMFSRLTSEDGRFLGAVGVFEDITEEKKSKEALVGSREYLLKVCNAIGDPIFVKDRQHRYILANDALCALAGRKREDILGKTDYDFFPKEQVDVFWEQDEIVFETRQAAENEEEITEAGGNVRTMVAKKTLFISNADEEFIVGAIRDITERKEAELALQAAHGELQNVIEFLPDATFVVDRDKKVIYWNRAIEEMTGVNKRDILGKGDYEYAIPFYGHRRPMFIDVVMHEKAEIEKLYDNFQRKGMSIYGEAYVAGAYQGKGAHLWSTAAPLLSSSGEEIGYIQSLRDISDRKRAEDELRQSEEKYRQLFETVSDAIIVFDGKTRRFIDVNEKACHLYGYSREEFLELKHNDISAEPDKSNASIEETLTGRRTLVPLRHHRKKDGTLFPAEISSSSFVLAGKKVLCGVVRDISQRIRTEEAIRQQLKFQQTLIDTIPTPIFYKNKDGRYLGCNYSFESYVGVRKVDIIGKTVYDVAPRDLADIYRRADLDVFRELGPQQYETSVRYADGTLHDVLFVKGCFTDMEGKVAGLVGVMLDMTERKKSERELSKYRDHLEEVVGERTAELAESNERLKLEIEERIQAEEALKMFAYSVAHDLKSPTIGIHGLTRRLHKLYCNALDDTGRRYCDQILRASEHVAALVDKVNVFMVTKEAAPAFENTSIDEVLRAIKNDFSVQLNVRGIEWVQPEGEVTIEADRLSLVRVFSNLVDNALKYGGERLSKISIGHEETEDFHIFSVADDGKGLKGANLDRIFRMFQRENTSRGVEGAGLGLTIVKEIIEKHGGKVWAEPGPVKGVAFYLSISKNLKNQLKIA
jgi:PAS domain S-box-containing protein